MRGYEASNIGKKDYTLGQTKTEYWLLFPGVGLTLKPFKSKALLININRANCIIFLDI